ncbi:hypothetical protein LJK88_08005 [Paenibacillus sp. P26]|nr:hypothetical protein LJK88_08005 [Paenibacillus sp. P26]
MLEQSDDIKVTAGQDATYVHTLRNTGAGNDTFLISLIGPYPADLYAGGEKIASGRLVGNVWVWDSGNVPAVNVPAGGTKSLKLVVHVPENTPYNKELAKIYSIRATGNGRHHDFHRSG